MALSSDAGGAMTDALADTASHSGNHRANALAAELEAIESGMHGPPATLEQIAQALHEMAVAGAELRPALIRAFVRRVRDGEPAPVPGHGARASRDGSVTVGAQVLDRGAFWQLCVSGGLTGRGQSREALEDRITTLFQTGRVSNPVAFLALVLHVKPWELAEIGFDRTREERLTAALASWRPERAA